MGSCSTKNLKNKDILRTETFDDYDVNDSIIKELSVNNNFLDELLPIMGKNKKFSKQNLIKKKKKIVNDINTKIDEIKQDIIIESNNKIDEITNDNIDLNNQISTQTIKIKKYSKRIKKIYELQNNIIKSTTDDVNFIFDEKIKQINNLLDLYNSKLKEIETKISQFETPSDFSISEKYVESIHDS
jgi:hypothetical protein